MMSYQPLVYKEQGGSRLVVASGGSLDVESSGEIDIESGGSLKLAGTAITSTAAELNLIDGADRVVKVARVALAAVDTAGGLFAWQNPLATRVLVTNLVLDVTTAATGACTADCGPAANGTTLNDTLIDGADVGTAAAVFDNIDGSGTNGLSSVAVDANGGTTDYVTGSVASGASAGIVGFAYIYYVAV